MSAYLECATKFEDQEMLVEALQELGWSRDQIQVFKEAKALKGYEGRMRKQHAELIIDRKHLVGASNDLGFKRQPDGTWKMIISEYDVRSLPHKFQHCAKPGTSFQTMLTQAYGMKQVERNAKSRRMHVKKPDKVRWGEPVKMRVAVP